MESGDAPDVHHVPDDCWRRFDDDHLRFLGGDHDRTRSRTVDLGIVAAAAAFTDDQSIVRDVGTATAL